MTNSDIASIFDDIAEILELKNENVFKIRAYSNAARVINQLGNNLDTIEKEGNLTEIPGIGKDLALKIKELLHTGKLAYYEDLKRSVPEGILDLIKIRGLGPRKANILYNSLGINNLDDLYEAIELGRLSELAGFGKKTAENIKKSIDEYRVFNRRFIFSEAMEEAELLRAYLLNSGKAVIKRLEIAGSLRRRMETVGDMDFVVSISDKDKESFFGILSRYDGILRIESGGETKISIVLKSGIHADFRLVPDEDFIYALNHFTGSKLHNEEMRSMVKREGYKINEYGIFKRQAGDDEAVKIPAGNEEEFYGVFNMQYIIPELREGTGEIEASLSHAIPKILEKPDIKGIFHVHTTHTDGRESLDEMVAAAVKGGFRYIGISDHSVSAYYANGLSKSDLLSQMEYIDGLNKKYDGKIKIFKGIESDIRPDGNLDYDEETLGMLDFVIASVHSGFNMPEKEMTGRIIKAVKNPYTSMIGHLTGRLLLERKGYDVDVPAVIDACSKYKTIIELNANPKRLDIDWRYIREALSKSVMLSINPDAHNSSHYRFVDYGVNTARKGWAEKKDVLNTNSADGAAAILGRMREYKLKLAGKNG